MNPRQLKIIALALVVLLVLWGASALFSRGSDTITGSLALPRVAPSAVDTIALVTGADSIVLARQSGDAWTVNGRRAATSGVRDLLTALADSTPPELVAEDSSSFARLGVDSAGGRWLRVAGGGKPLVRLVMGARGSDFRSVYVRRPGDAHVFLWRGGLGDLVDRKLDDWRDKRIAALVPDSIVALEVDRTKDRYTLRRGGGGGGGGAAGHWTLNGAPADSAAVARYLERLRAIMAQGFATPAQVDSARGRRPTRRLVVRGAGDRVLLSLAFDSTAGGVLVQHLAGVGGEGATVYRMNVWDVDGVTPASRSLLPAPPPSPTAKKQAK